MPPRAPPDSILLKLERKLFAQVDIASLVFFRIAFGLLMLRMVKLAWSLDRISQWWIDPPFLFKYLRRSTERYRWTRSAHPKAHVFNHFPAEA